MTYGPFCAAVNATLLYLRVCDPSDVRINGHLNDYTQELLERNPQFAYQLFDQPITTFFDPEFDFSKFPAVRQWLYTGWREQRVDEFLRLHDTPGAVTPESLFLQFAPVYGSNNNIVGYLPHTAYGPSYRQDLLRMYTNSTSDYDYMAFYVDGKQAFLPDATSPYGSPRVECTEIYCNGVRNPITKFIRSSDPYLSYPQFNALEYLNLHPSAKMFRKLLAAACPPYLPIDSCKWEGLANDVFTLLFATDDAFKNIHPSVLDYIFAARDVYNSDSTRWQLALRILENHVLGSPTEVFGLGTGLDPLSALLDQDPAVATTECDIDSLAYNANGLLYKGCEDNVRPFPSYWYIDQMRDISRINGTLFLRTYLDDEDRDEPHFLGAYDYQNGYKFRVPGVQACDYAFAQYPYVDIELENALVHKINNVLIPEDVYAALLKAGFSTIYTSCPNTISRPNYQAYNGRDWTTNYGENIMAAAAEEDTTTDTTTPTTTDTTSTTTDTTTTTTGGNTQNLGASGDVQASGAASMSAVVGTALGAIAAAAAML